MQQNLTSKEKAVEVPKVEPTPPLRRVHSLSLETFSRLALHCFCQAAHLAACVRAQNIKAQLERPQRQTLSWMKDDEDMPAVSGSLLTVAAPAPRPKPAAAAAVAAASTAAAVAPPEAAAAAAAAPLKVAATAAVVATETEPAEAAELVQARSLP